MHTLSGQRFELGGTFCPSSRDVAIGLSRIPRWAGATIVPWSVLQHSLATHRVMVKVFSFSAGQVLRLRGLWHDCEEMATGDIPKPFKTGEQAVLGDELRAEIFCGATGLPWISSAYIYAADALLRTAEAHCFCHPRAREDHEGTLDMDVVDVIWKLFDLPVDDAIAQFVTLTDTLLEEING